MATTTQNLGLIKPAGTDKIRIAQINSNMDTIDTKMGPVGSTSLQTQATNAASSISALQSGMAIVCNGNTHAAIASGNYAYVRNHSSLAEGLYQATAAIAANATLSASNLTAVSGGWLNMLQSQMRYRIKYEDHTAADLPSAYSLGLIFTNVGGQTYGFPYGYALVLTFNSGGRIVQCIVRTNANTKIRSADGNTWSEWNNIIV